LILPDKLPLPPVAQLAKGCGQVNSATNMTQGIPRAADTPYVPEIVLAFWT